MVETEIRLDGEVRRRPPLIPGAWSFARLAGVLLRSYNTLHRSVQPPTKVARSELIELCEIQELASVPSDINEHLEMLFAEALLLQPKLIVELGVRTGASTFVFERVAKLTSASIVSADLDDCSSVSSYPHWHFFHGDDIQLARCFGDFCAGYSIAPMVDLLFIDTSHYYEHTIEEIASWFPLLSARAKVIFHDTNMGFGGKRKDGCFECSWDNHRGVIRAIEDFLGTKIDEKVECTRYANGWLLRHWPHCNGLTILDRIRFGCEGCVVEKGTVQQSAK